MREIKFRLPIKLNGQKSLLYYTLQEVVTGGGINLSLFDWSGDFQLFTGLKDKNGREIYEGDIVKYSWLTHLNESNEDIGEVYFEDGIFYFDREMSFAANDGNFCKDSLEIIGNIYENPELLK